MYVADLPVLEHTKLPLPGILYHNIVQGKDSKINTKYQNISSTADTFLKTFKSQSKLLVAGNASKTWIKRRDANTPYVFYPTQDNVASLLLLLQNKAKRHNG